MRIASVSRGDMVMTSELDKMMEMNEPEVRKYFESLRSVAEEDYVKDTAERTEWMRETSRLMERQKDIISALESRMFVRDGEIFRLRDRVDKTFESISSVEGEVKGLQKVLYDCEVGRTELEEDFVLLVKSFNELEKTIESTKALEEKLAQQKSCEKEKNPGADA